MNFKVDERYNAVVIELKGNVMGGPDGAQQNMRRAMELGAQTREGELRMGELCDEVADSLTKN